MIDEIVDKIRGPKGTPVVLTIQRGKQSLTFHMVGDEIVLKTVFGEPISKDIGYIHLSSFISQDAANEMRQKLEKQKNTRAMIQISVVIAAVYFPMPWKLRICS